MKLRTIIVESRFDDKKLLIWCKETKDQDILTDPAAIGHFVHRQMTQKRKK